MKRSGRVVGFADCSSASAPELTTGRGNCELLASNADCLAWVQVDDLAACRQCSKGSGCGISVFSSNTPGVRLLCATSVPVAEGDRVTVEIQEPVGRWLPLVACAYGLPLFGLLTGTVCGTFLGSTLFDGLAGDSALTVASASAVAGSSAIMQEVFSIVCAAVGLSGGLFAWRRVSQPLGVWTETGLCFDTARIVAVDPESMESEA